MTRFWHNWLFILAAGLLVIMLASTLRSARLMEESVGWVLHTGQVSAELFKLRSQFSEAESVVRGHAIVGVNDPEPDLNKMREGIEQSLHTLRNETLDNQAQQQVLKDLELVISERFGVLAQILGKLKSDPAAVPPLVKEGSEKSAAVLSIIDSALDRETTLSKTHEKLRNDRLSSMGIAAIGSGVLALVTAAAGIIVLQRSQKQTLRAAQLEVEKTRAEQSDEQKSRFLANMSHEIRTPMNAILGFTDLLADSVYTERERSYVNAIQTSGRSLLELINDILDLSRIEAGKLHLNTQAVELRELVESVRVLLSHQISSRGIDLVCRTGAEVPSSLMLDGLRVRQILLNLVSNAIKFTSAGSIKVEAFGSLEKEGGSTFHLQFRVTDTGSGIAQEDMDRIFSAFEQAAASDAQAAQGTGLGLSITQRLVQLMGGTIDVESKVNEGSVFHVSLPGVAIGASAVRPGGRASNDLNEFQPARILVVDDIDTNRDLIAGYFAGTHHELFFAGDGMEAITKAQDEKPDVILMDVRMPKMDGTWARELLKANGSTRKIPVIAQTASSMSEESERLQKFFDGYLRKPFNRTQLHQALAAHLKPVEGGIAAATATVSPLSMPAVGTGSRTGESQTSAWPELIAGLRLYEGKTIPRLQDTLPMLEVGAFARLLHDRASLAKCTPLREYADKLLHAAEEFELDTVEWLLRMFHELLDSLDEEAKAAAPPSSN